MTSLISGALHNREVQGFLAGAFYLAVMFVATIGGVVGFFRVTGAPKNGQCPSKFWASK